jgi:FkbM family methyltransferase
MKAFVKRKLQQLDIYQHLKYSGLFRLYEGLFKKEVVRQHEKEVSLYRQLLGKANLIFDIGAYDGHKTAAFLEISKTVVSCEPDPHNFRTLQVRFRNKLKRVKLLPVALSSREGEETFLVHHEGSAFNTLNPEWQSILEKDKQQRWQEDIQFAPEKQVTVVTTTLDNLIKEYGMPDFIKIDVEGYEMQVFQGLSQPVPCISFEMLLPEFDKQLDHILHKLIAFDSRSTFNVIYNEELLFPAFINYEAIREWIRQRPVDCFDMVVKSAAVGILK